MKNRKIAYEAIGETDENIIYKRIRHLEDGEFDDTVKIPKDFKPTKYEKK